MSESIRLRHIAQINPFTPEFDKLPADTEVTFMPLEAVWPGARLNTTQLRLKSEVATGYTRFCEGDILIPKITPTFEADRSTIAAGLKAGVGVGTTELHIIRPNVETDRRYVRYLLSSHSFLLGGEAEMIGVAGQKRVPDSWLRNFPVPVTTRSRQVAIADFLDIETARIDALIAKKRRLLEVLNEHLDATREEIFVRKPSAKLVPLMHLTDPYRPIVYGIVQAGPEFPDGVPYIKSGDLPGLNVNLLSKTDPKIHSKYRRASLRPGDIVMAMRASIGAVATIPECLREANLTQGTARIAPAHHVDGHWLFQALQTRLVREQCRVKAVGTTFLTLNIWDLRRIVLPAVPMESQARLVREFRVELERYCKISSRHTRQIALLQERRQTLITAAVTG